MLSKDVFLRVLGTICIFGSVCGRSVVNDSNVACGTQKPLLLNNLSGNVSSPNFPQNYPPNSNCAWSLQSVHDSFLAIQFNRMDMEYCTDCLKCDYLAVYDSTQPTNDSFVGIYCGDTKPNSISSSTGNFYLEFVTDDSIEMVGFDISYTSESACGSGRTITESPGNITSPFHPEDYPANSNCEWRINAPRDKIILLVFESLNVEEDSRCENDYVEVYNGPDTSSPMYGRYCGAITIPPLLTDQSNMLVRFKSDQSDQMSGFKAQYQFVDTAV